MKKLSIALFLILAAGINIAMSQTKTKNPEISSHRLKIVFNEDTRSYELYDAGEGLILSAGIIHTEGQDESISTNDPNVSRTTKVEDESNLAIDFDERLTVEAQLVGDTVLVLKTTGDASGTAVLSARAPLSYRTMAARLIDEKPTDKQTLVQSYGKSGLPGLRAIFDPMKDLAVTIDSEGEAEWDFFHQWQLKASAETGQTLCRIKLVRNYYRDRLGVEYYAPIKKRSYFQKAPTLAMTWVGIEGKYERPDFSQRKEWLYPNIKWVADHLLPYAGEMVFQLDDNYPTDDPQYMRDISDYIRSKGLIPGIWLAPFGVAPYEQTKTHPEWFIHDADGKPITTFSGLSYDDYGHYVSAVLNVNNKEAVDTWFAGYLREMSEDWNYDYFKVDGIPAALKVYQRSVDGGGVEGVRRGLQILRSVLGPDKYINTCWGLPIEGIDIVNGSRVGGDTERLDQVVSRVAVRENYLNNVAWYSDPDGAALMYASTVSRARLNFLGRALLGQPYVTDDKWTMVPDKILEVWQKTLPNIESFPVNLYKIKDGSNYDHFDLKITKPWGQWDVVALNNYEKSDRLKELDLGRLALSSEKVYVFDFWNNKYLGEYSKDATITRNMKAIDAHCFAVVPAHANKPVLLSTSRHFTQGGVDLEKMNASKNGSGWVITGLSSHLVNGDPYELVFKSNGYTLETASANDGTVEIIHRNGIAKVKIWPDHDQTEWTASFQPDESASVSFGSELVHVIPGERVEIPVNVSNGSAGWKVKCDDPNLEIRDNQRKSTISVEVDPKVIEPEKTWTTSLTLESKDAEVYVGRLVLEAQGPDRDNIAPQSEATASSIYFWGDQKGYGRPAGAKDGLSFKPWEAAEGETSGWVELAWKEPVTFQRIVIDECVERGGLIQSWTLEAGHKKYEHTPRGQEEPVVTYDPEKETMEDIATGKSIGRGYVIELDEPVTANVLKLVIHQATGRPGVWDIIVNPADKDQ